MGLNETKWTRHTDWVTQEHYTFLLPTVPKEIVGEGVGLAIKNDHLPSLLAFHSYSSRVLRAKFKGKGRDLSVVVAYFPTNATTTTDTDRDKFYRDLQTAYTDCGSQDVKLLLMDGNVETGNRRDLFPNLLGPHAVPEVGPPTETTPNGERFIDFCITNNLILGYSWFQKPIKVFEVKVLGKCVALCTSECSRRFR